ncbi:hypothetical protein [Stenotrophomonas sp. NPDC078853]|uniref:hypothetical protein n=1 Tax=Stenotrophomonas sp. NPDC078853 TaxID=3364534 RepID=UPI00384A7DF8
MALHNAAWIDYDGAGMPLTHSTILDRTTDAIELLARTKTSLGEVSLTADEAAEMSRAMVVGNDREIGRLFREASLRHAREMVAGSNILDSEYETAVSLLRSYA